MEKTLSHLVTISQFVSKVLNSLSEGQNTVKIRGVGVWWFAFSSSNGAKPVTWSMEELDSLGVGSNLYFLPCKRVS